MAVGRNGLIAAIDVGSTKVACFIARAEGSKAQGPMRLRVVGLGHHLSRGVRSGTVVDMDAAEQSIRAAVDAAEKMAGETIMGAIVNVSCGAPRSQSVSVDVAVTGQGVNDADMRRVLQQGRVHSEPGDRALIHSIPVAFTLDGNSKIRDPRGMYGDRLGVQMHVVTAASGPLRNLSHVIERCHLTPQGYVASAYASGLATLVEDEMDLGVTCIDMGGGTTTISVFFENALVHVDVIPLGGQHVTNDIARGLTTPLADAERMKTLYGSAIPSPSDERELIAVPQVGEEDRDAPSQIPRTMLTGIIQPRLEETFELVRDRLKASGFDRIAGRRVVLTGGASQLTGVREMAARMLDKQVRIGRPLRLSGLADAMSSPAFATAAGLLSFIARGPLDADMEAENERVSRMPPGLARIGQWLRQNL
jgi:cell division protein FtsA